MGKTGLFQAAEHRPFLLEGGRPAALLVHGFPGTPAEMRPLGEAFQQAGWTAQGLLLPGFGPEIESLGERTTGEWIEAVSSALVELQKVHAPVLLLGYSMGAGLAIQAAARQKPDGLALLAPLSKAAGFFWRVIPLLKYLMPTMRPFRAVKLDLANEQSRQGLDNFLAGMDLADVQVQRELRNYAFPLAILEQVRNVAIDARQFASQVTAPVLAIQGSQDPLIRPASTRSLLELFGGPVEYLELPAAHDLPRPDQPHWPRLRSAVLEFAEKFLDPAHHTP